MRDIYNQYKFMNFKELREYYAKIRDRQKFWYQMSLIGAVAGVIVSILGFMVDYAEGGTSPIVVTFWDILGCILFGVCVPLLPIMHTDRKYSAPVLMGAYTFATILVEDTFSATCLVFTLWLMLAVVMMTPLTEQLNFMKALPDFPFPERVEAKRLEYEQSMRFSETSAETQEIMNKHTESYDGSQVDQLLSTLPKRHYEARDLTHGEFDEIETEYTDKLVGEGEVKRRRRTGFVDPKAAYQDIDKVMDLNIDRRDRIEETDPRYKDYKSKGFNRPSLDDGNHE